LDLLENCSRANKNYSGAIFICTGERHHITSSLKYNQSPLFFKIQNDTKTALFLSFVKKMAISEKVYFSHFSPFLTGRAGYLAEMTTISRE
jgi:hypothetical protein